MAEKAADNRSTKVRFFLYLPSYNGEDSPRVGETDCKPVVFGQVGSIPTFFTSICKDSILCSTEPE